VQQSRRARVSLGGHLVFERLFDESRHLVAIDPARAGYFTPPPREIVMPQVRVRPDSVFANAAARAAVLATDTRIERLMLRPEHVVDGEAMVVRGYVVRASAPAEGVAVTGTVDGAASPVFTTQTNSRGNFAIRLRPPDIILGVGAVPVPVTATARLFFDGVEKWRSDTDPDLQPAGVLRDLATHAIRAPIDVT
ncbi:hypothetical protein, partial [Pseudophaeobacter sp.]|uniref:hypothetical protein n=1 Tax=Pseudophaeobacter sp. TaxID=1971739 RepID=UPI003299970C